MIDHDQNFKNLILDYPKEALLFFAPQETDKTIYHAKITPVREQQLKDSLGKHYRELDIPLLIEWENGERETLLFAFEEETETRKFSIYRLAHYCLDLAELMGTQRVIPVVIFLHAGRKRSELLQLGSERQIYLEFRYLFCYFKQLSALDYCESDNIVIRLNLPNMQYKPELKLEIYAAAQKGLMTLETDVNKQSKYADFIDIYAQLTNEELSEYRERYLTPEGEMMGLAQVLRQEGRLEGHLEGHLEGQRNESVSLVSRLLRRKLGIHPEIEKIIGDFKMMPIETLEELAEALLDFSDKADLMAWLQIHQLTEIKPTK